MPDTYTYGDDIPMMVQMPVNTELRTGEAVKWAGKGRHFGPEFVAPFMAVFGFGKNYDVLCKYGQPRT